MRGYSRSKVVSTYVGDKEYLCYAKDNLLRNFVICLYVYASGILLGILLQKIFEGYHPSLIFDVLEIYHMQTYMLTLNVPIPDKVKKLS